MTPILIVLAALLLLGAFLFNRLVRLKNQVDAAWADIDVQLTRRHDLVPHLVAAVRAYAGHERSTLERATELRTRALATESPAVLGQVESELEGVLSRIFALREAYPDLKANQSFLQLQRDLVEVEEHLQYARRFYNGAVRDYNTAIQRVPDVLVAQAFRFGEEEFFQAAADARGAASVELEA